MTDDEEQNERGAEREVGSGEPRVAPKPELAFWLAARHDHPRVEDPLDANEYIEIYTNSGSGGWYQADDTVTTTAWSFNTYKLLNSNVASYLFELNSNPT